VQGELSLRLRLTGRMPERNVYLAMLAQGERYVIPPLDRARVTGMTGRWLLIEGVRSCCRETASGTTRRSGGAASQPR
jgi:hypothetical protein